MHHLTFSSSPERHFFQSLTFSRPVKTKKTQMASREYEKYRITCKSIQSSILVKSFGLSLRGQAELRQSRPEMV